MNYYNEFDPHCASWLRELIKEGHIPNRDVDGRSITEVRAHELTGYTQHHFFAGIGGWSIALRLAGWPDDRPVKTGSCPCQPFSLAGERRGTSDERHLWPVWSWLLDKLAPTAVFGEQVAAAVKHGWLDGVACDLEKRDYAVGAAVLSASAANAPHRRDRLWFAAYPERDEQSWQEPCRGETGRMGGQFQLLPWDGEWPAALARFRAMGDGISRCVAGTDAARNAIVPQIAAQFILAAEEARADLRNGSVLLTPPEMEFAP